MPETKRPTKDARRRMAAYAKGLKAGRADMDDALADIIRRVERLEAIIGASGSTSLTKGCAE